MNFLMIFYLPALFMVLFPHLQVKKGRELKSNIAPFNFQRNTINYPDQHTPQLNHSELAYFLTARFIGM